ncbi:RDD family protein [uncultured Tenacibaculum sp.]|uniref:RDD family protein n=1 Tax=uncultured Tenacibaculum sp. TaxID=174713 RepID=UPI0026094C1F|nr:RDD family protein [uncultured Tenacibaculum sp.]
MFEEFEEKYKEPELASIPVRILAFIIDLVLFWLVSLSFSLLFGENYGLLNFTIKGLPALFMLGLWLYLWPISEGLYGQTIGKRFMDIKVIGNHGKPMNVGKGFLRFLFGMIDLCFLLGILIALIDKKNSRLGDIIADTKVVKSKYISSVKLS